MKKHSIATLTKQLEELNPGIEFSHTNDWFPIICADQPNWEDFVYPDGYYFDSVNVIYNNPKTGEYTPIGIAVK